MEQHQQWFDQFRKSKDFQLFQQRPIAFFCAEFALTDDSPTYAGGLGVLAGDIVREAVDQKLPLVAVGLYYHEGYLHHELYSEGTMLKHPMRRSPNELGFKQVLGADNQVLSVSIPLQGRKIAIQAWELEIDTVRVFLLDTDLEQNDPSDRGVTNRLYVANKETRFKQEMVMGIGGMRLLEALKIHPMIYHLNEGHSALLALEVAHHEMNEYTKGFAEELDRTKQHIVFTNHTLLAAGNDTFNNDMVSALLSDYSAELQVPVQNLVSFGLVQESSIFSMTILAMRLASRINAVSKLHAEKAKAIWTDHPMIAITNGVHLGTWDKIEEKLQSGKDAEPQRKEVDSGTLWNKHQENKRELLSLIQKKAGQSWNENDLLIGWARRMVNYKRPLAIFQDKERLLRLLKDTKRPVRIVMAGSAHESDTDGAKILEELQRMITTEFDGYVVYLPNYNVKLAKVMTAGCDVWLNTPVVGFEACGTSGMKACMNGVLPATTKDGWTNEVELYGIGWPLDTDAITDSILSTIEHNIVPMYYYKNLNGAPEAWIENMHHARQLITNDYSATRMLRQYVELMYLPAVAALQQST